MLKTLRAAHGEAINKELRSPAREGTEVSQVPSGKVGEAPPAPETAALGWNLLRDPDPEPPSCCSQTPDT